MYHLHETLMIAGEFEQAAEAYSNALRLDADYSRPAPTWLWLIGLDRFDEASDVLKQGVDRGLSPAVYKRLYLIAFLKGDTQSMERHIQWFVGKPDEYQVRELQARCWLCRRRNEASRVLRRPRRWLRRADCRLRKPGSFPTK